jgi:hypothetical protein
LSGTYAGVLTALGGGLFVIDGTWQVTGGSGRFAGANGSGVLQGLFTLSTASAEVDHIGTIQY